MELEDASTSVGKLQLVTPKVKPNKILSIDFDLIFTSVFCSSATAFPATHQSFSAKRQLFLKFSNFCKKIDFEAFFMHILAICAI